MLGLVSSRYVQPVCAQSCVAGRARGGPHRIHRADMEPQWRQYSSEYAHDPETKAEMPSRCYSKEISFCLSVVVVEV